MKLKRDELSSMASNPSVTGSYSFTVPKKIDFPRYNMKCSGENVILRGIFHVISCFPLHFMLYHGNFACFSSRVVGR